MATSMMGSPVPFPREQQQLVLYLYAVAAAGIAWCAVRALEWAWWRPRRLDRALRSQGLRGTAYRPVAGDVPLGQRLNKEARCRTMPLGCHDVVPRAMPLLHQTAKEHGKMSFTWLGPVPRVTITKPELVREVLSNKSGHSEKLNLGRLQRMLHNGVGGHEGEKWAKHRRIINPAFHLEKLKRMLPAFAACCTELVSRWEGLAAGDDAPCEVDVWPEMQSLTGDVISRAAFGSSYLEGRRIFQLQGEQIELAMLAMSKMHIPGYLFLPTKANRRMRQIAAEIGRILKGIIAKRENALRASEATSDDLLGLLLESNMAHCRGADGDSSAACITTDDVIGECKLFYFAGMETTAVLLTWTMLVLCMHPEWQDRAREEVMHVLGVSTTPDYDGLGRLKIVTMVLYEVLRLYTPLTALQRRTCKPMDLGGRGAHAAAAVRPPRQGGLGCGCRRVQAREVRRGVLQGVGGRASVLPVRVGPADLRRPELRAARGQDGACHDPAALLLGALAVLRARALPRRHAAARARRANQAQEALLSCILQNQ